MTMKLHTRRYKYKVVSSACSSKEGMYMMWLWWRYSTYADINIRGCLLMRFENIGIDIEAEAHADERMQWTIPTLGNSFIADAIYFCQTQTQATISCSSIPHRVLFREKVLLLSLSLLMVGNKPRIVLLSSNWGSKMEASRKVLLLSHTLWGSTEAGSHVTRAICWWDWLGIARSPSISWRNVQYLMVDQTSKQPLRSRGIKAKHRGLSPIELINDCWLLSEL